MKSSSSMPRSSMPRVLMALVRKDLCLTLSRGGGLVQALLLGLLLIFVLSLSQEVGTTMSPQGAAALFWLASAFCQVLIFNMLYALDEGNSVRQALLLMPQPVQCIWLSKAISGLCLLLLSQMVFLPASIVFLGQTVGSMWTEGLLMLVLVDVGMVTLGSLLGALACGGGGSGHGGQGGQSGQGSSGGRESLLSIVLFPLLVPLLLAGIRVGAAAFSGIAADSVMTEEPARWIGIACAFDALFLGAGMVLFSYIYAGGD